MHKKLFIKDNFDELKNLLDDKKPFALFLGAGINADFPKMKWTDLLNGLMKSALSILTLEEGLSAEEKKVVIDLLSEKAGKYSLYQKATLIKKVLGDNYISYLQSHLYSNCNKEKIEQKIDEQNIYLIEIAKFILKKKNIKAVITYNYDNYLTETIALLLKKKDPQYRSIITIDIFQTIQHISHEENIMPIYHVHGFIPPPDSLIIEEAENVVLSIDEYFKNMIEPFSWQTTTQLFYLNNYNCIFLGVSLDDWNMMRALSYSGHFSNACKHFALFRNDSYDKGKRVSTFMNRIKASVFEDLRMNPIFTETDNYHELSDKLNEL